MKKVFIIILSTVIIVGCSSGFMPTEESPAYESENSQVEMLGIQKIHIDTLEIKLSKANDNLSLALKKVAELEILLEDSMDQNSLLTGHNNTLVSKIKELTGNSTKLPIDKELKPSKITSINN